MSKVQTCSTPNVIDVRRDNSDSLRDERGSVLPLLALVLLGFAAAAMVVVSVSQHVVAEVRAQAAADAAALAGAAEGEAAGRLLAEANGAQLISYEMHREESSSRSHVVVVEVALGNSTARAAAARFASTPVSVAVSDRIGEDD